jgi:hypothetical protein
MSNDEVCALKPSQKQTDSGRLPPYGKPGASREHDGADIAFTDPITNELPLRVGCAARQSAGNLGFGRQATIAAWALSPGD